MSSYFVVSIIVFIFAIDKKSFSVEPRYGTAGEGYPFHE